MVDFREKSFISQLSNFTDINNDKVVVNGVEFNFIITNLEVGDFVIKEGDNVVLIVERKTVRDLCSSIKDGRFRQQKERLNESVDDESKIVFVIEGSKIGVNDLPRTTIDSTILNMVFRHNYKVLCTHDELDTFLTICLLVKKVQSGEFAIKMPLVAPVKLVSKGSKIGGNLMAIQLSAIPGVSYQTAMCISKEYNTMKDLIIAYSSCSNSENMLKDISITEKRKIGPALSKKIYQACCLVK